MASSVVLSMHGTPSIRATETKVTFEMTQNTRTGRALLSNRPFENFKYIMANFWS
jgi:hypothetical protein